MHSKETLYKYEEKTKESKFISKGREWKSGRWRRSHQWGEIQRRYPDAVLVTSDNITVEYSCSAAWNHFLSSRFESRLCVFIYSPPPGSACVGVYLCVCVIRPIISILN